MMWWIRCERFWKRLLFEAVLRFPVPPQVHFALEAFAARVAAERFEAGVFPAVRDEVGALAERFAAHLAFVRLFSWKISIKTR